MTTYRICQGPAVKWLVVVNMGQPDEFSKFISKSEAQLLIKACRESGMKETFFEDDFLGTITKFEDTANV